MKRLALCDVDAVIVRESDGTATDGYGGKWHTVTARITAKEARQLADELVMAAKFLEAKERK